MQRSGEDMNEVEKKLKSSISKAETIQEIGEFWDTHSLADHWEETREAPFEVRAGHRRRVTIDPEIYNQLEAAANTRGLSPETLANLWLAEHLRKGRRGQQGRAQRNGSSSASASR